MMSLFFCITAFADEANYSIVVDAGSSGTRMHLFKYTTEEKIPLISNVFSEAIEPGLSSYETPEEAAFSLKKLFDDVAQVVKQNNIDPKRVAVILYGTGGMRLLSSAKQDAIYAEVKKYIENNYAFPIQDIQTITGEMEGVYDWLDINYLKNTFQKGEPTVGAIDMGGASTQIVFATHDHTQAGDEINLTINGVVYTVYSKSFIGLGQEKARQSMSTYPLASACNISGYIPNVNSAFDFSTCNKIYTQILADYQSQFKLIPFVAGQKFIAYSGVNYVYRFLDVSGANKQNLEERIHVVCNQTWDLMQANYPDVNRKYMANYCSNAAYLDRLLYEEYHLQDGQLEVDDKIDKEEIDWPLGKMVYDLLLKQQRGG